MNGTTTEEPSRVSVPETERILTTKVKIPRTRPTYLTRSRLFESLDDAMEQRLTVVSAPAGFGKTTLLADWAQGAEVPVAWVSLDEDDDDPTRFWRYVAASLDSAGIATKESHVLDLTSSGSGSSSEGLAAALIEDLEGSSDDFVLVLDDYHTIDSPNVHDGMSFLLTHEPPSLHVVVSGRVDPPLPLARMRANDELVEVRASDLRFTPNESHAFLKEVWDLDIDLEAAASLQSRTEGWAAGLQLAALSLQDRSDREGFIEQFTGTHRYVLDYLTEEVLEAQPTDVREFLVKTSILERLTGSLCDIVTGRNDGQVMLEMLDRANLFVIPLDEDRAWYRFHRLFRDVLSARLQQRDPNSVPELHRRAADWCAEHGLIDEAIRHALAGGLATTAAQHVENNLSRAFNRGEGATVVRWLSLLPDELVSARPRLGIAAAMMAWHVYRLDGMDRSLRDVESAAEQVDGDDGFEVPTEGGVVGDIGAATALLRAQSVLVNGRTAEARTYLDQARQRMRDNELGPRFFADWLQGAADWVDGDMEAAEPHFARMLDKGRATPSPHPLMISCSPLGHIREARGDLDGAVRTYRVSLRLAQEARRPSPFHLAEAHLGMARVLYQRGELDSALRHATEGLDLARQVVEYLLLGTGLQTLAWIRNAMGDDDMARAAVDESIQLIPEPGVASFFYPGHAGRVKLLLAQGDVRQAQEWIGERRLSIRDEVTYNSQRSHVLLARVLIAEASHDDAIGVLERLKELAQRQGRNGDLVEIECLMARASEAAGDQEAALSRLAETLTRASPQRYIRVFVNEGAAMSRLLRLLTASESGQIARVPANVRGHIARIQRAFGPPGSSGEVPVTDMIAPLTSRELDVLQLLAAGRRNREIADELYVALDTVKKHVSHILEKLAAGTRTEAVAEAARLGLLDGPRRSQD